MPILKDNFTGLSPKQLTVFDYQIKDNVVTFNFDAKDSFLYSYSYKNNDDLWRACVVEIFLDTGLDFYYEFEVAPNGALFTAKIRNRQIEFIDNLDFIKAESTVNGKDYKVQMVIDLNKLERGNTLKFNAFRVETKENGTSQLLQALNPTLCETFHVRDKFINL